MVEQVLVVLFVEHAEIVHVVADKSAFNSIAIKGLTNGLSLKKGRLRIALRQALADHPRKQSKLQSTARLRHAVDRFFHLEDPRFAALAETHQKIHTREEASRRRFFIQEKPLKVRRRQIPSPHGKVKLCTERRERAQSVKKPSSLRSEFGRSQREVLANNLGHKILCSCFRSLWSCIPISCEHAISSSATRRLLSPTTTHSSGEQPAPCARLHRIRPRLSPSPHVVGSRGRRAVQGERVGSCRFTSTTKKITAARGAAP